jgi:ABC-type transport system substrate-binding protein
VRTRSASVARRALRAGGAGLFGALALAACSNSPYPDEDARAAVRYRALVSVPKTLDPAVSYDLSTHQLLVNLYEPPLEYHYLKRPYQLIPGLVARVPEPEARPGGRSAYAFELRPDLLFQDDPCFAALGTALPGLQTRALVASDLAFAVTRIADPEVGSPVSEVFAKIAGFREFAKRLSERRAASAEFRALRIDAQYREAGGIEGLIVRDPLQFELQLSEPDLQFRYWFAMTFTAPVPWEAVAYYDGNEGRDFFKDHPVGAGPYRVERTDKQGFLALGRNPNWYGARHPEWKAPAATYPSEGEPGDAELGLLDPAYTGRPLPFLERIEFRLDKEAIPRFNKFVQGYYDVSGVSKESFDRVIIGNDLSPDMRALGISLKKSVDLGIFYLGFNMRDAVVGQPAGLRGRKLRQALSLAIDSVEFARLFMNGRGVPAQSPLPPGLFGYDPAYRNPYRQPDLARARSLLTEAGYAEGRDPATGRALRLTLDVPDTSTSSRLQFSFYLQAWQKLGIDAVLDATHYNRFQDKVRDGAYQVFFWGWHADFPDPENFLFMLYSPISAVDSGGVNYANFSDPRYDELYRRMKNLPDGPERERVIREMIAIVERERPWIELFHSEDYALIHGWLRNVKPAGLTFPSDKYTAIDPELRRARRLAWNQPVRWPAALLGALSLAVVIPGIVTFFRERQ